MKKKILFCASTPLSYAMFKPLHRRLDADGRFAVTFTANHDPAGLYREIGLSGVPIISKYRAMLSRYDLCICPSFFYERRNADVKIQIFHGCSLKNRAVHEKALAYDRLFLIGPYMRSKFVQTWNLSEDDPRLVDVGMPKLDAFFDGSLDRSRIMQQLDLDPGLPTVIYAPTRTSVTSSSLQMFGQEILDIVSEMPVNFLVKLHDRAYRQWKPRMRQDWKSILERYRTRARLRIVSDYDVVPYLFASDLLISDISSVVNEFTLLDRPIVLIHVPRLISHHREIELKRGLQSSDLEQWGQSCGTLVRSMDTLRAAIEQGLTHPEEHRDVRREFATRFFYNPGQASGRALEQICSLAGLPAPQA